MDNFEENQSEKSQEDKIETVNITDPSSGKLLKTVELKNGVPHGAVVIYDDDGSISHKLNYVEGVLSGEAEFFQKNQLIMKTNFSNNVQDGETIVYLNGNKSTIMHYKNGMLDGSFLSYDEQGHLVREVSYEDGKMQGDCNVYYPDGALMEHSVYKDNLLDGEMQRYYQSGIVREISTFENGKPVGYIDTYDIDGNLQDSREVE